jgi:hypothetical protein
MREVDNILFRASPKRLTFDIRLALIPTCGFHGPKDVAPLWQRPRD